MVSEAAMVKVWIRIFLAAGLAFGAAGAATAEPVAGIGFGDSLMAGYQLGPDESFPAKLEAALRDKGHDVEIAHGGLAGLEALRARDFDLIVSDLRMPDLDGRGLWERAEGLKPGLSRRFLFITGDTLSPLARDFLVDGARPHLEKPVVPTDLRAAVAEAIAGLDGT